MTAFAIAIRRLQGVVGGRDGRDGVAVLMRYTLRLLTLQQFQRAAALLCACELRAPAVVREGRDGGAASLGPDADADRAVGRAGVDAEPLPRTRRSGCVRQRNRSGSRRGASPMQLARCPWCGSPLTGGRDVELDRDRGRTLLTCSDVSGQCEFTPRNSPGEGLPVVVVDEEVYRLLPALVIATVDKFARMPWEGRVQALFGQVSRRCERHGYLTPGDDRCAGSHPRPRHATRGHGARVRVRCVRPI